MSLNKNRDSLPIIIQKFGYKYKRDTINSRKEEVCIDKLSVILDKATVSSSFKPKPYFLNLIKKTKSSFPTFIDTVFYNFNYSVEIPDSDWTEELNGVLAIPFNIINDNSWQSIYYSEFKYSIDSSFLKSGLYKMCPGNRIVQNSQFFFRKRKFSKLTKKRKIQLKIDKALNSDSLIVFDYISKYKERGAIGKYFFNRSDSLLNQILYYTPKKPLKFRENDMIFFLSETVLSKSVPLKIESHKFIEYYINKKDTIEINFNMKKIDDLKTIEYYKTIPFKKIMMISTYDGIATILRKEKEKKKDEKQN
ncbi:MAG TPA: hypothetical protein ENK91_11860 [Bacteroidetes bacterium]|nr:hypothetical protein [Bacteroidota bacterium]